MTLPALKVLLAEDRPPDAELVLRALRRAGLAPQAVRVETEPDFLRELAAGPDIVISDYQMPQFSGLRALELLVQSGRQIPFILVSGTIGEDTAVMAMRAGASDYLLKDRLERLGPAVTHALEQSRLRRERRTMEADFALLFAENPMPMWVYELGTLRFLAVNHAAMAHYGYSREEFLAMTLKEIRPPEEVPRLVAALRGRPPGRTKAGIWRHRTKAGKEILVETTAHRTTFLGQEAELVLAHDVTQRLAAEKALRESEARLRAVTDTAQVGLAVVDAAHCYRYVNPAYVRILNLSTGELAGRRVADVLPSVYAGQIQPRLQRAFNGERVDYELVLADTAGERRYAVSYVRGTDAGQPVVVVVIVDVTALRQSDLKIRQQWEELLRWQEVMLNREDRVVALKAEVNALLTTQRQPVRYPEVQKTP